MYNIIESLLREMKLDSRLLLIVVNYCAASPLCLSAVRDVYSGTVAPFNVRFYMPLFDPYSAGINVIRPTRG